MPTPTADIKNSWYIPLIRTSQDKSTPRLGVMPEKMAELVGVDGTVQGGLRPLSGFTEVQELDWFSDPKHDYTSNILDWDATSFRIGSEDYGYGAVYKAERKKEPRPTPPTVMSSYSASHGTSPGVLYLEVADVVVTSGDSIVCSVFNWGTVQTTNVAWAEDGQLFEQIVNSNDDPGARANPPKQAMYILKNPAPGTNTVTAYFTGEEEGVAMSLSVIQGLDHDQPIVNSQFLRQDAAVNADFDIFTETVDYLVYTAVATRAPTVITNHTETTVGLTELTEVAEADATWGLRQSTYSYDTDAIEDLNLIIRLVGSAPVSCWISSLVLRYPNGEPGSERSSPAVGVTPAPWPEVHYSFGSAIIDGPTCCTNPAQFTLSLGTVGPDDDGGADGGWGGDPDPESLLPKLPAISLDDNYNGAVLLFVHTGREPVQQLRGVRAHDGHVDRCGWNPAPLPWGRTAQLQQAASGAGHLVGRDVAQLQVVARVQVRYGGGLEQHVLGLADAGAPERADRQLD
jgi:hypothetical protein